MFDDDDAVIFNHTTPGKCLNLIKYFNQFYAKHAPE